MNDEEKENRAYGCLAIVLFFPVLLFFIAVCAVLVRIIIWAVTGYFLIYA